MMLSKPLDTGQTEKTTLHKDGELYRTVTTFGRTFELRYGYYDERDRESPLCAPAVIYPDFTERPLYTARGEPFVTMLQDACAHYVGESTPMPDTTCAECGYFERGEEWFGICRCFERQLRQNE